MATPADSNNASTNAVAGETNNPAPATVQQPAANIHQPSGQELQQLLNQATAFRRDAATGRITFTTTGPNGETRQHVVVPSQQQQSLAASAEPSRSIRVPTGIRQISIPTGAGNNVRLRGQVTATGTGGVHQATPGGSVRNTATIPRVQIPPLVAQPTPIKTAEADNNEDEYEQYRCCICCEFMTDPSSCGTACETRFCRDCLLRVAKSRSTANPTSAACPACRSNLTEERIVSDLELKKKMDEANITTLCPYRGCGMQLSSSDSKQHELSCPHTPMRCKNASMGCNWRGLRKDLAHHVSEECAVEKVAGLVDQFRHSRADTIHALSGLLQRQVMTNQMVEVSSTVMRHILPAPTNVFDILALIYSSTVSAAYFIYTKDVWRLFLHHQSALEHRGAVANFLYLLPTTINICRTAIGGYRILRILEFNEQMDLQLFGDQLDLGLLSVTPFLLLLTTLLCFLVDGISHLRWASFTFRGMKRPILRDMAIIGLVVSNLVIIECDNAGLAAAVSFMMTIMATFFFSPVVLNMLHLTGNNGVSGLTASVVMEHCGRSISIVSFGLQLAALMGFVGISPAIDACIIMERLRRASPSMLDKFVPKNDAMWSCLSNEVLSAFLVIRFAHFAVATQLESFPILTILAMIAGMAIHFLIKETTVLGLKVGALVYAEAKSNVYPHGRGIKKGGYSVYGSIVFCSWASMLMFLAASY